ncbi:MAG: hypothetical protein V4606_01020 [Patescibacteria group bacterium]
MKTIRIVLGVLIVIGLGLLITQSYWLPRLVDTILDWESDAPQTVLLPETATTTAEGIDTWNWVYATTSASGTQFNYPNPLPTIYVSAVEWPPQVVVTEGTVSCLEGDMASHSGEVTSSTQRVINNQSYCVSESKQGAAGTSYTQYQYATKRGDFVVSVLFTLKTPQCMNYDEPRQSECQSEQAAFPVDELASRIIGSAVLQ